MKRLLVVLSVALAMLFVSSTAFGQSWKDKREAQKLAQQARYHMKKGEFKEAAVKFKKADELTPSAAYKVQVAKLLVELGDFLQARQLLKAAAESKPQKWAERKSIKEAGRLLDEVKERTPTLDISVKEPAGIANVTIDGSAYSPGEGAIPLNPGDYEVVVTASGYESHRETVTLREGDRKAVEVSLKGGKAKGDEDDDASSGGGFSPIPAIISWSVAGAGLALGIGFGVAAIQSTNDVLRLYDCQNGECPAEAEDDLKVALLNGNISTGGFVVGGVAGIAGVVFTILTATSGGGDAGDEGETPSDGVEIEARPVIGPGYIGIHGTF